MNYYIYFFGGNMSITWIIVVIVVMLVVLFIYNGFRTRCPYCGDYSLHPKDEEAGYTNAHFNCKNCNHSFSRKSALNWLTIANKLGEEKAIQEYKKLQTELDNEFNELSI